MPPTADSFYATWRQSCRAFNALREFSEVPPERLLQAIWHHQRLRREELRLLDGRTLRVLHPGFWNHGAGPDFRDAVLQFSSDAPFSTDVELDLDASGWRAHGHDRNPTFNKVKLHVVWSADKVNEFPTLALKPFLDAPLPEIGLWLGSEAAQQFPAELLGQCASPLRDLSDEQLEVLLNEAAVVRLQSKAADLHARARQCGWEQALWEGLLRALGYKQNVWPMQCLGELRQRFCDGGRLSAEQLQARLLGASGLLPTEVSRGRSASDTYLRTVWDQWWRERDAFHDCVLPRSLWRLNGLRPANHPQRRLALAAHWWTQNNFVTRIEKWFTTSHGKNELAPSLLATLQAPHDGFWSWHWTLRSASMKSAQPLLGETRVTDLAVNVILPWLWVRAREGQNTKLLSLAEARYFAWPAAEDNSVLRLARNRLLGGRRIAKLRNAAMQQGLMQVVRDFCDHANALCGDCKFPELVCNWKLSSNSEAPRI
ncbi:MAG TPA: DUF2851 family protein [Candidatus Acidoferrum sp.]|nr:DUF2851 family protein [Candidatus Acidoferrum sp.]